MGWGVSVCMPDCFSISTVKKYCIDYREIEGFAITIKKLQTQTIKSFIKITNRGNRSFLDRFFLILMRKIASKIIVGGIVTQTVYN